MRMRHKKWSGPELAACPYFVPSPWEQRGHWHERYPERRPLWVELGCGKGGFLASWAMARPDVNFLGVDQISDMLGVARRKLEAAFAQAGRPVENVLLTPWDITRCSLILGPEDRAQRIFINFCNPWFKPAQHKKRLTHPRQLAQYREFLAPGGEIWFKTDDTPLYIQSLRYFEETGFLVVFQTEDLHASGFAENVETEHERMYSEQGVATKFCIARLPDAQ